VGWPPRAGAAGRTPWPADAPGARHHRRPGKRSSLGIAAPIATPESGKWRFSITRSR